MAASDDAVHNGGRWTLIDGEGNVQGSDSDIGSVSSSDCVAVEEDTVSYHAKRSRSSTGNSVSGSPPRNQIDHPIDNTQNVPTSSSSWLGGFWTKNNSPANANSRLNESEGNEPLPSVPHEEKDTHDTESLESIEVLSMPSDGHSDTDIHPNNEDGETPLTFDPLGAVGSDWNRHGDVVKPMCATNVVTSMDGLSPTPCVEDLTSSSNSSQLDFLIVDHQELKNGAIGEEETASNENPRGAVGGNTTNEEDQMERSVGTAEPLPTMPPGQLPFSSVSVDNIPRGVEAGGSPRRAQSEGCIAQQSEEVSDVGVPIMTQRWPTEDGGFLLVQQFRGDGEPAMSRSSSFSDLSSSFSYPGVRRRIPTNSTSSLQRQSSETSSSEASHYNSDSSNDALPANMTVSGIKPGIRQYLHQRDESLNSKLTLAALIVVTAAMALVLGHYIGSMQATSHHLGIEAGQVWRLRSLQDQLVTCLDKTKTLLRGAKGSTGTSQPKATSPLDPQSSTELPVPPVDMIQESDSDDPLSCSVCENREQPLNRYSKLCNTQCKHSEDSKNLQESLSSGSDVSDHVLNVSPIGESFAAFDMTGECMPDVHTATQIQGEPETQGEDTAIDLPTDDADNTGPAADTLPLSEVEPVDNDGPDDGLVAEGSVLEQDYSAEAEENERGAESVQKIQGDTEISLEGALAYEVDSSSTEKHDALEEAKVDTEDVIMKDSHEQGEDETLDQVEEEFLDQVEEEYLDQVGEEFLDQVGEEFLDQVEEEFLDQVEEEFLDKVEEEFLDQGEVEFLNQVEVESQARGEEEPQDPDEEDFFDKEAEFSDSSSHSPEDDDVGSQEEIPDSPNDGDFMGKLSAKLSDSWFILRNFTTDLVGSAANLSVNNVTTKLKENVETLRHQIKDAVSNLQKSNITSHLKDNVNSLGEHLKDAVSNIKEGNFSRTVKDTMEDLGGKVRKAVSGIKESNITSQIKEGLHGLGEKIQGAVSGVKESGSQLKKPFKNTMKAVKNLMKGKPVDTGKETDEGKTEQEDLVQPKKPSTNKKKRKSNRKSPGQVAKQKLKRKEGVKNKRKGRKKINTDKNAAKHKNDMKTNRRKNNHNKDQTKNQPIKMKKGKSHTHYKRVNTGRHGKSKNHEKNKKKHQPNQVNQSNRKNSKEKRMKRKDKEMFLDNKDIKKNKLEKVYGNGQDHRYRQEHLSYRSVPSRKIHGDSMDNERKREVEQVDDMKLQPDDPKATEDRSTNKERKYHKDDPSQKGKQFYEQRHWDKRKHESEESSSHRHNHQRKHNHHPESNNQHGHRHKESKHRNHHHDKADDDRHRFGDKMWEESTHHQHYQSKHNHQQEKNNHLGHRHEDKKHGKENQEKEDDAKFRFEDIKWEDIFDSFDVRCFGVRDCLRKQREAAVKLYEELLDYQDWLTKRCYKKHLDELKDFMEELEEFLAEPFLTDADLEELMEDFEDMAEDIEEATTKNFWKFMKTRTTRHKGGDDSESSDRSKRGSNKKKQREDKEKTLIVTLDLKQALNSTETVDVSESDDYRRHGYQSNDDWFIRRMQDRENSRNDEDQHETLENDPNESNDNWYDRWMQGREEGRIGMTVWDLYQWFSKRQALRHEWRLHEMDDQSNWFLRRP